MLSRWCVLAACLSLLATDARAACTGATTTWSCPAGTTSAELTAALGSATDGATLTFAAGSYTWTSWVSFSNSKGASLVCATVGACTVTVTGTVIGMNNNLSGTNTHLYRISGFAFSGGSYIIWFYGSGTATQLRIDHNTFTGGDANLPVMFFGDNIGVANFYGVIDHNTVTNASSVLLFYAIGGLNSSPPVSPFGTINNLFVEDNTITTTTITDSGTGCMDSWGSAAVVWRHNTTTNCVIASHGTTHAGGPANLEIYNNSLTMDVGSGAFQDCYRCIHHQGSGEFIVFNNSFTAYSGKNIEPISLTHYRSFVDGLGNPGDTTQCDGTQTTPPDGNRSPIGTYRGYPCWRQPGRDGLANLKPVYIWNNYWSDTAARAPLALPDFGGSPDYFTNHLQANRDYYQSASASAQSSASSPFDGTTGAGFGTLANRPTTCTTNALESGGGVGYFATNQGAQGTLYRCSATNTWSVQYEPYPYPHPLVATGASRKWWFRIHAPGED